MKLKESGLLGRGGAAFPTWKKWQSVLDSRGEKTYIICNASEGEPDVHKDKYLLEHRAPEVISGIKKALHFFPRSSAYIYINPEYYRSFGRHLKALTENLPITIFIKRGHYLAGEETALIADIEGKRIEPTLKPPYPYKKGLYGAPTLANNVETFYYISQIDEGHFLNTRFYTISGEVSHPGVFELPERWTIERVLLATKNDPAFDFFVQVGGGVSGEILSHAELKKPASGAGSIRVYRKATTNPMKLMGYWADFYLKENCDKCLPCREGMYRISEMVVGGKIDISALNDIAMTMKSASFCPLGRGAADPFVSLLRLYKE